jgi:hypothetical protein
MPSANPAAIGLRIYLLKSQNRNPAGTKLSAVLALLLAPEAPGADGESPLWAAPAVRWPAAALLDRCIPSLKPGLVARISSACHLCCSICWHGSAFRAAQQR